MHLKLVQKTLGIANITIEIPVLDLIFKTDELVKEKGDNITLRDMTNLIQNITETYDEYGNLIVEPKTDSTNE